MQQSCHIDTCCEANWEQSLKSVCLSLQANMCVWRI